MKEKSVIRIQVIQTKGKLDENCWFILNTTAWECKTTPTFLFFLKKYVALILSMMLHLKR